MWWKTIYASERIKRIYVSGVCCIPEANIPGNGLPYFFPHSLISSNNLRESA